jgi:DNA-binding transcriptional MerR regulator
MAARDNLYLIKDLSRLSGHSVHTLKFYLKRGLITESGRTPQTRFRYFDDTTLSQLSRIRALRKQRKSLAEIQRLLGEVRTQHTARSTQVHAAVGT